MIKGIFFDFDGTLCDLVEVHYEALNEAIEKVAGTTYTITRHEQNKTFNGLSTKTKLKMLVDQKGLSEDLLSEIAELKQSFTLTAIENNIKTSIQLIEDLQKLKEEGYLIYCVSNATHSTIVAGLKKLGIFHIFDHILGNNEIKKQKPAPEIYLRSFIHAGLDPKECLIVEDSKHGRESAVRSCAHVCTVDNQDQTTYEHLKRVISECDSKPSQIKWKDNKLNVLIPMAGLGSRFKDAGFKLPKPLIDIKGKPMIQWVVDNLNVEANFIFIVQKSHYEEYNLGTILPLITPDCKIVQVDGLTEGAACTTLLAKELINNDKHLLIANSDQFVEWDSAEFMYSMIANHLDGGILTFQDTNPKWSFAKLDEQGFVTEVAEKKVISDLATSGIYYFNKGSEYVLAAEEMIEKNIRSAGEFYVCPVYNILISQGKKIKTFNCDKMLGTGTPSDLDYFVNNYLESKKSA